MGTKELVLQKMYKVVSAQIASQQRMTWGMCEYCKQRGHMSERGRWKDKGTIPKTKKADAAAAEAAAIAAKAAEKTEKARVKRVKKRNGKRSKRSTEEGERS